MENTLSLTVDSLKRINLKQKAMRKEMVNPSEEELKLYWESRNRNAITVLLAERLENLMSVRIYF